MNSKKPKEPNLTVHVVIVSLILLTGVGLWQKQFILQLPELLRNSLATITQKKELSGHAHYSISDKQGLAPSSNTPALATLKQSVHYEPAKNSCWQTCLSNGSKNCEEASQSMRKCIEKAIKGLDKKRAAAGHSLPQR